MLILLISIGLILGSIASPGLASEVCGTNLITYRSANEVFKLEDSGVNIGIAGFGSCEKVCALRDPICGSDARTYYNYCHLVFAFRRGEKVEFLHPGPCGLAGKYVGPPGNEQSVSNNLKESKYALGNLLVYKSIVEEAKGTKDKGDTIDLDLWTRVFAGDYFDPIDNKPSILNKLTESKTSHKNAPVTLEIIEKTSNSQENYNLIGLELLSRVIPSILNIDKKDKIELSNLPVILKDIKKGRNRYSQAEKDNLEQFLKHAVAGKYLKPGKATIQSNIKKENSEFNEADLDLLEQFLIRDVERQFEGSPNYNQPFVSNHFKDETFREDDGTNSKETTVHFRVKLDPSKQNFIAQLLKQGQIYKNSAHITAKGKINPFKTSKVEVTGPKVDKEKPIGRSHKSSRQGTDEDNKLKFSMKFQLPDIIMESAKPVLNFLGI